MVISDKLVFIDNNATTRLDDRVLESMMPYLKWDFANPNSSHSFGLKIRRSVENAREQLANRFEISPKGVIFTSGATESINMALKGLASELSSKGRHIITVATEHFAVLNTCKYLESIGFDVTYLNVKSDGTVDLEVLRKEIRVDTILVSIMYANNETGVIQPIKEMCDVTQERGIVFFTDFTQGIGKVMINPFLLGVDAFCISGHKFHGPKGIGALLINTKKIKRLESLIHGGDQEFGLRAGTLNVPGIIGMSRAIELSYSEISDHLDKMKSRISEVESKLLKAKGAFINGGIAHRISNTTNICIPGLDVDHLISRLPNVAISNGSACTSSLVQPSHVLLAMGLSDANALSSIRISLSKFNSDEEITQSCELIMNIVNEII